MRKLPDDSMIDFGSESECDKNAALITARYLPFLYGVSLFVCRDASSACDNLSAFISDLGSILNTYDRESDITRWVHAAFLDFLHERNPHILKRMSIRLTAEQQEFLKKLAAGDEQTVSDFESAADRLSKPQKECMRLFFFEQETFEGIAQRTGYLTDKIRSHIESGTATLCPAGDPARQGFASFSPADLLPAYLNYLKGYREDSAAYGIESASIFDPFLSDAVEGCIAVDGNHAANVSELGKKFGFLYSKPSSNRIWIYILIASITVTAGVAAYLNLSTQRQSPDPIQSTPPQTQPIPAERQPEPELESNAEPTFTTDTVVDDKPEGVDVDEVVKPVAGSAGNHKTGIVSLITVSMNTDADGAHYTSLPKIGWRAYDDYLSKAAVELDDNVRGDVTVAFNVNRYGRPSQIRITEYLTPEAHREAIRLLDIGPEWSPTDHRVTIVLRFK